MFPYITTQDIKKFSDINLQNVIRISNNKFVVPKSTTSPVDINKKLLVNTKDLMQILSCGKPAAIRIGEDAHAKICIGRKILWNVECIKKHLNNIAE